MSDAISGTLRAACLLVAGGTLFQALRTGNGAAVTGVGVGAIVLFDLWRDKPRPAPSWTTAGIALLGIVAVLTYAWALRWSSIQGSDFGVYWRCGVDPQLSWSRLMGACRSRYISLERLYAQRSFFYTLPFGALLGADYRCFKLYNATLHVLTATTLWIAAKRLAGPRAALIALAVLAVHPDWWFCLTLAAPDNLALLAVVAVIWAVAELGTTSRPILWTCVLGVALLVAHWSRSLGALGVAFALVACALAPPGRDRRRQCVATVGAVVLFFLSSSALDALLGGPVSQHTLLASAASLDLRSEQDFTTGFQWQEHMWRAIPEAERMRVAIWRILDELRADFMRWPAYMAAKARVLFRGDGYLFFATWSGAGNVDTAFPVAVSDVPGAPWIVAVSRAATMVVLVMTVGAMVRDGLDRLGKAALAFMAAFLAMVLGFSEVQSRYSLVIAPAIALVVASAFRGKQIDPPRVRALSLLTGLVLLVVAFAGGAVLTLLASRPDALAAARQGAPGVVGGVPCNGTPVSLTASRRVVQLRLAPGVRCATVAVPVSSAGMRRASFFVTRTTFPFPFEPSPPAPFEYGVRVGPGAFRWQEFGVAAARWSEVALEPGGANERLVEIAIRPTNATEEIAVQLRDFQEWR
jgi:hypothetical protein